MTQFNLDILFKQTTSEKIKCRLCKKSIKGEEGYIKINLIDFQRRGWRGDTYIDKKIVICQECFKKYIDKITIATENKSEIYDKLVKTKILKGLK